MSECWFFHKYPKPFNPHKTDRQPLPAEVDWGNTGKRFGYTSCVKCGHRRWFTSYDGCHWQKIKKPPGGGS